ncbi:aminotransferase class III-fold pyridoxal phosphate-dependent enzyme [Cobetia marina]
MWATSIPRRLTCGRGGRHGGAGCDRQEDLIANAERQGEYFKRQLQDIQARFEEVSDVRGAGLFLGLDICDPTRDGAPDAQRTTALINDLKRNGVLIGGGR